MDGSLTSLAAYEKLIKDVSFFNLFGKSEPPFSGKPVMEGVFWQAAPSGSQHSPHPRVAPTLHTWKSGFLSIQLSETSFNYLHGGRRNRWRMCLPEMILEE